MNLIKQAQKGELPQNKVLVPAEEGGTVTSDDGNLTLEIPAGALDSDTEIAVSYAESEELPESLREIEGAGPGYHLQPDGLTFNDPVTVSLDLAPMDCSFRFTKRQFIRMVEQL